MIATQSSPSNTAVKTAQASATPSRLHALLCVSVLFFCVLIERPFVEMGINDDWSFIRTAQMLAQTGHMAYNGWAAMILGWQAVLGALFIRLFGFSFTVARAPIFLLALLTTYVLHRVLARFGLNAWNAALLTLTVVLSPTFLPLVFTFMSDVAGMLCLLVCLYACQRALQAQSREAALGWLYFAAISNILDGTVRQIAWLGVLVMVPCTAWLLRHRKGLLFHGAALWVIGFASVLACMRWYAHQPYSVSDKLIDGPLNKHALIHLTMMMLKAFLSLLLFSLPVLVVFPLRIRELGSRIAVRVYGVLVVLLVVLCIGSYIYYRKGHLLDIIVMPWMVNLLTPRGILHFNEILGAEPIVLQLPVRILFTFFTIAIGLSSAAYILLSAKRHQPRVTIGLKSSLSWAQTTFLLLPFSLAYLALLMPRAASVSHTLFDRYTTPMMIVLGVFALRYLQEHSNYRGYALSTFMLLLFTMYTVAGTHDVYAEHRARLAATEEVTQSGVARTALDGGFEYDGWTQLLATGYVNDPGLTVPSGAYHPVPPTSDPCRYFFLPWTPVVNPRYALSFDPTTCYRPSRFAAVPYTTWLPPHHRAIYVQAVP